MKKIAAIILTTTLAACNQTTAEIPATARMSDEQAFAAARAQLLVTLKDPDSAKFGTFQRKQVSTGVTLILLGYPSEKTDVVCGTVNARNGFGGYTGAMIFAYRVSHRDVFVDEGPGGGRYGTMWCLESSR
jgi:hypothetical protein